MLASGVIMGLLMVQARAAETVILTRATDTIFSQLDWSDRARAVAISDPSGETSDVTFMSCTFTSLSSSGPGGAVRCNNARLVFSDCNFTKCSCSNNGDNGGAIYATAEKETEYLEVSNSNFSDCTALEGCAIYCTSSQASARMYLDTVVFDGCGSFGGAIYLGGDANCVRCQFLNSPEDCYSGAALWTEEKSESIQCVFESCLFHKLKGVCVSLQHRKQSALVFNNSVFSECTKGKANSVIAKSSSSSQLDFTFCDCVASYDPGSETANPSDEEKLFEFQGDISVVQFSGNTITGTNVKPVSLGIQLNSNELVVQDCTFKGFSVQSSWFTFAREIVPESLTFINVTFDTFRFTSDQDTLVSPPKDFGGKLEISECKWLNTRWENKGIIITTAAELLLQDSLFQQCQSAFNGVVQIDRTCTKVTVSGCDFKNNTCNDGGAQSLRIMRISGPLEIVACSFSEHVGLLPLLSIQNDANPPTDADIDVTFKGCYFENNEVDSEKGLIELVSSKLVQYDNCHFVSNTVTTAGCALLSLGVKQGSTRSFVDCEFRSCSVPSGLLTLTAQSAITTSLAISMCTFIDCDAADGIVLCNMVRVTDLNLTGCIFNDVNAAKKSLTANAQSILLNVTDDWQNENLVLENCTFSRCQHTQDASLLYLSTKSLVFELVDVADDVFGSIVIVGTAESSAAAEFEIRDCCFATTKSETDVPYLDIRGTATVTFSSVCFDVSEKTAINYGESVTVKYSDHQDTMFGACTCGFPTPPPEAKGGLPPGAIAGIIIAVLVIIALVAVLVILLLRRKRNIPNTSEDQKSEDEMAEDTMSSVTDSFNTDLCAGATEQNPMLTRDEILGPTADYFEEALG